MKQLIKDTIFGGVKDTFNRGVSAFKAKSMQEKHVQSMIGPESVFGRVHMEEQKRVLKELQKRGDHAEMRKYQKEQFTKAGLKKVNGNYIKI